MKSRLDYLLYSRDDCPTSITCTDPPPCNCTSSESCVRTDRTCNVCPVNACVANPTSSKTSKGIGAGAVAGAVVAVLVFAIATGVFIWWYRRRLGLRKAAASRDAPKEAPARAEDVLNRPDPNEKPESIIDQQSSVRSFSTLSNVNTEGQVIGQAIGSPIHSPQDSTRSNPFEDVHSILTTSTSTQGTNVIPIALVPHGSLSSGPSSHLNPMRPGRTPELDLNLDHVNVSRDGSRANTPQSQASGAVTEASNRNSYLSSMSYASDFLNEVPVIVNATRGNSRQVMGVHKAEVVSPSSSTDNLLKANSVAKPSVRSPLAGSSFGPADVLKESDDESATHRDPFDDKHERSVPPTPTSPVRPSNASAHSDFSAHEPTLPWGRSNDNSRPTSISTQAGSIIAEIGSAARVQVGGFQRLSPNASPALTPMTADSSRNLHRMTSARLVAPPARPGPLEEQQQRAIMAARGENNRQSSASAFSTVSTKADSILESFPFVPPSPISDRPARTGLRSPRSPQISPGGPATSVTPSSPLPQPDRRVLGMSTGSQISTMSAGLGAFPFQIDSGQQPTASAPSSVGGRQRASLDTLALTSDLSSYPLGFDKEAQDNYPLRKM